MVARVLPDAEAASNTIHTCQTAILNSASSVIRHRALSIMAAMYTLLNTAAPQLAAVTEGPSHAQPNPHALATAVTSAASEGSAKELPAAAAEQSAGGQKVGKGVADTSHSSKAAGLERNPGVMPQNLEQVFAKGFLDRKTAASGDHAQHTTQYSSLPSMQQQQQQQQGLALVLTTSLPTADDDGISRADAETDDESDLAAEEVEDRAVAAALRQQIVDDAVDRLLEESMDGGSPGPPDSATPDQSSSTTSESSTASSDTAVMSDATADSRQASPADPGAAANSDADKATHKQENILHTRISTAAADEHCQGPERRQEDCEEERQTDLQKILDTLGLYMHPTPW